MMSERERISMMNDTVLCSDCGVETKVSYDEGGKCYCFNCAFSYGAISEDQWRGDNAEEGLLQELSEGNKQMPDDSELQ